MTTTQKNSLTIRLTESVVFLRSPDFTGRRTSHEAQPSMLRGLLVLNLVKPTRISSIELEFQGKATTAWPEGVGARRIDITEEHKIFNTSTVFFRAGSTPSHRRNASVGPGLALYHDDEGATDSSHDDRRGRAVTPRTEDRRSRHPARHSRRVSADSSIFQRNPLSHQEDKIPTPPYTPTVSARPSLSPIQPHTPTSSASPANSSYPDIRVEDDPAHTLEEFRRALRAGLESPNLQQNGYIHAPMNGSSASSLHSYRENSSRRASIEDVPEEPPSNHSLEPSRNSSPTRRSKTRDESRGRTHSRSRFSLTAVSNVLLDAVKDRVRSSSPRTRGPEHGSVERGARGRKMDKGKEKEKEKEHQSGHLHLGHHKEKSAFGIFGDMLGLDGEESKESGDGWKEFKKGTYTYPISIAIPGNSPPSLDCEYGGVRWHLRACVHRPGTFVSKLSATREVMVITTPDEDATEDTENIIVERQWDSQLQYLISVSGRCFYIGGTMPMQFTILPLAKAKVHRISVILEERVDYYTQMSRIARTDPIKRFSLLSIKLPTKEGGPILPLVSDDPEAFKRSPLYALLSPEDDPSEVASSLMGPGPWTFHHELKLPASCGLIHFTNKNRKSNIRVTHALKVVFRVERGDDLHMDPKTGNRKLFDIVVQTPVHILSCRCNPDWISLPRYTQSLQDPCAYEQTCPCEIKRKAGSMTNTEDGDSRSKYNFSSTLERMASHRSTDSNASSAEATPINPATTPSLHAPDSLINRNTQFERLISGQESEMGEAPPSYDSVARTTALR